MNQSLSAISAVSLITISLLHATGLAGHALHLSFMPVWLLFMTIIALPLTFIEAAMVRRTQQLPLQALVPMTRDADAKTTWRLLPWLAGLVLILLIGYTAQYPKQYIASWAQQAVLKESISYLLIFFAIGFAWVGMRRLLKYVGVLVPIALIVNGLSAKYNFQIQLLTAEQWQMVAMATLLTSVLTLGVYAWLILVQPQSTHASRSVLPLWLTQTVIGLLVLTIGHTSGQLYVASYMFCAVFAVAILADVIAAQLQLKSIQKPIAFGGVLLLGIVACYLAEYQIFDTVLQSLSLLTMILYCIFVGWIMKISHVRKALNFSHEGIYNLWRVAIRLVVPLTSLWLLLSLFI